MGFMYGQNISLSRSRVMSRKFTIFRFVLIVIDSPSSLNCFVMFFLILSACGPEMFSYAARPSSRYSPLFTLITAFSDNLFSMYRPTSSHISAPSYDPIVTSNKLWFALLVHAVSPSNNTKEQCPLQTNGDPQGRDYIGLTEGTFKKRFTQHKSSFKNIDYSNKTSLSKYVWSLKNEGKKYKICWSSIDTAKAYNNREFKMPTTNNGYGVRLKACFRVALTKADKIYISHEHTFHRSDLGYSVKIAFLCCKTESTT